MSLSNKTLKSFQLPDLDNVYNIPEIADEYISKKYDVGDYVNYQGVIYRCTTQISVAEAWNASHWTAVKIANDIRDNKNELTDLKSAIERQQNSIVNSETLDFSTLSITNFYINASQNAWLSSGMCWLIPVTDTMQYIEITANTVNNASCAFLKSNNSEQGVEPDYCNGTGLNITLTGQSNRYNIPFDCAYIYVGKKPTTNIDFTPQEAIIYSTKHIPAVDVTFSVSNDAADSKATGDAFNKVWNGSTGIFSYDKQSLIDEFGLYSTNTQYDAANRVIGKIFPTEITATTVTGSIAYLLDISDVLSITYPMYKNTSARGCLILDENMAVTRNLPCLTNDTGTLKTISIESDEKYFVFVLNSYFTDLEWNIIFQRNPVKGLNTISEDIEKIENVLETLAQNDIFSNPILNAEIVGFICYGQSWSMGYDTNAIVSTQRYDNIMLDSGLMNDPATDLVVSASGFSPLIEQTVWSSTSYSQKCGETPCTAQTDIVKQLLLSENGLSTTDIKYQMFSAAPGMGNRSIEQLSKGTDYYTRLINVVTTANNIARSQGKVFIIPAISWTQGSSTNNDATYYDLLEQLRLDLDTDIKAITGQTIPVKLIAWQAITPDTTPKRFYDRYVYASEKYENIICSGTFYNFEHKADNNLHLIVDHQDWLGCQLGIAYKRSVIDGEKFIPLKPKSVEVYGNIAYLDFHVPVKPIVFDTNLVASISNYGFQIFDSSNVEKTISLIEIVAPDKIKIVCTSNFASTDHIVYGGNGTDAYNPQTGKRGNLRDSQPIVYKNHQNVELPCYNWCVVFDKTIAELTI